VALRHWLLPVLPLSRERLSADVSHCLYRQIRRSGYVQRLGPSDRFGSIPVILAEASLATAYGHKEPSPVTSGQRLALPSLRHTSSIVLEPCQRYFELTFENRGVSGTAAVAFP